MPILIRERKVREVDRIEVLKQIHSYAHHKERRLFALSM